VQDNISELPLSSFGFKFGIGSRQTYTQKLFHNINKEQRYFKNKIFMGWIHGEDDLVFLDDEKEDFYLPLNSSDIWCSFGSRGSGKTFLSRGDGNRSFKSGYACIYLTDIKGEMRSNNKPLQKKFEKLLNDNEIPEIVPTTMLLPLFMEGTYQGFKQKGDRRFQFTFSDLNESEWLRLLHPARDLQVELVKRIVKEINNKSILNFDDMIEFIENQDFLPATKQSILLTIGTIKHDNVIGDEYNIDLCELLEKSIVAINFTNYETLDTSSGYPQIYVSIILRKIIEMRKLNYNNRKLGLSRPVNLYIDEAHAFCPNIGSPPSKKAIEDIISVYRYLSFSVRLYTQFPEQLPGKSVLNQVTHFFIPYNIDMNILIDIVKRIGWFEYGDVQKNKWIDIKKAMKKHWWMYINKNDTVDREVKLIKIASPLSHHLEESGF